jgi:hypothetical protein
MLTIPDHKGNPHQNHTDSTSPLLELLPSRTPRTTNGGKDAGEKEPSYTVGGNIG